MIRLMVLKERKQHSILRKLDNIAALPPRSLFLGVKDCKCDNISREVRPFKPREDRIERVWQVSDINTIYSDELSGVTGVSVD